MLLVWSSSFVALVALFSSFVLHMLSCLWVLCLPIVVVVSMFCLKWFSVCEWVVQLWWAFVFLRCNFFVVFDVGSCLC